MYKLPDLPYDYDALESVISKKIMELHHGKHHAAYVNNVNKALAGTAFEDKPIEEVLKNLPGLPENIRTAVQNNGGGHANHTLFWQIMHAARENNQPSDAVMNKLKSSFGGFQEFKDKINQTGMTRFGSGWSWLVKKADGELSIYSTANQDSPIMDGHTPILGVDVWEHAYYLDYLNDRAAYLSAWWQVVNWDEIEKRMK